MRVRGSYTYKGRTYRVQWVNWTGARLRAEVLDPEPGFPGLLKLDARLQQRRFQPKLEGILRHELLHIILGDEEYGTKYQHKVWCFRHDHLAKITETLDGLLRTGSA